jgi:hypothetical protein
MTFARLRMTFARLRMTFAGFEIRVTFAGFEKCEVMDGQDHVI